ncbi:MAG TPA: peptidylprolyl isomerase [Burkholderiaceae bacterium]|jgi:peptidyl-prolyl cis-trans isomerase C
MKKLVLAAAIAALSATAGAQNITLVNGKPVPKARYDLLLSQVSKNGQPVTPEVEAQVKDEVVLREIFMQAAEKAGIPASADFKAQLELARQSLMIRTMFQDYAKKNPVSEADARAEYEKFKAAGSGTEYKARHILVENEDQAKALIAKIKLGAKFEDLAKTESKDPGSAVNGGDLDWANGNSYVPEFTAALAKLKKGEMTDEPVKSQFGYHIIKLEDTRQATFPAFDDVKAQILQRMEQQKVADFQNKLKEAAKTDYKFSR